MADFEAKPPVFQLYLSDSEGNIDFKDRDRSIGLWARDNKDSNGNTYYGGKKGNRRVVMYKVVPREQRDNDEGDGW
jgi:hypothetical protein